MIKQTETALSMIRYLEETNRTIRLMPTASIMADYFLSKLFYYGGKKNDGNYFK